MQRLLVHSASAVHVANCPPLLPAMSKPKVAPSRTRSHSQGLTYIGLSLLSRRLTSPGVVGTRLLGVRRRMSLRFGACTLRTVSGSFGSSKPPGSGQTVIVSQLLSAAVAPQPAAALPSLILLGHTLAFAIAGQPGVIEPLGMGKSALKRLPVTGA